MFSVFRNNNNNSKYFDEKSRVFSCFWCRIDKKKCDRKRPTCSRCIKFNLNCKPYETDRVYKAPSAITKSTMFNNRCRYTLNKGKKLKTPMLIK